MQWRTGIIIYVKHELGCTRPGKVPSGNCAKPGAETTEESACWVNKEGN